MFVTEGPIDPRSPLFVGRAAELTQMEAWLISVRCVGAVLGARQTGKTSLLLKLRHLLHGKYAFVFVDLEAVAGAALSDCLAYIASEMISQFGDQLGDVRLTLPTKANEFLGFLEQCARAIKKVRIVVLLDEIGALLPATSLQLTSAIRAVFTSRHVKPEFARYVFVVAGSTDALDVTAGHSSPLKNVTETLYLEDLSAHETTLLVAEMFGEAPLPPAGASEVLHGWTNGHPYWTQRLGEALHRQAVEMTEATVRIAVEQLLSTEDRNLPYVFRALDADRTLRELAGALVAGTPIPFSRSNGTIARLELIGLLKNDRGRCAIRNRIYREALHREPVRRVRLPARDLHEFNDHLSAANDVDTLLQIAALNLQTMLQCRSVIALSARVQDESVAVVSNVGGADLAAVGARFDAGSRFLDALTAPVAPADIERSGRDTDWIRRLETVMIVPVRLKDSTPALFCLGRKLSGDGYELDDLEFLTALSGQTAGAIDRLSLRILEREMKRAWDIQRDLLPAALPQIAGVQIAGSCQPALVVGGDYYDAFTVGDRTLVLCVGDVVGKGMPAALLMANLQAAVKSLASATLAPSELCQHVNRVIAGNIRPGQFITFFYALLDTVSRQLRYTNAGHNPPIVVRGSEEARRLGEGGPVLGIFPDWNYEQQTVTLAPGDRLLLYTDGVTEVRDGNDEEFGDDRLITLVRECSNATALHNAVIDAVTLFSGGAFLDDVTVLAVTC